MLNDNNFYVFSRFLISRILNFCKVIKLLIDIIDWLFKNFKRTKKTDGIRKLIGNFKNRNGANTFYFNCNFFY
jgi:hypothetical protein